MIVKRLTDVDEKMSITTEVAPMDSGSFHERNVEENRDPNNLNEHLQVCLPKLLY